MARRARGRPIHGWLCLDKPAGLTSTQALGRVKRLIDPRKAGHGGTLDPIATGILPIALGEATKTVAHVMDAAKTYRFTARFGEQRTTDDSEGELVASADLRPHDDAIRAALPGFTGEIDQTPPIFAAVKIAGERAYDMARRGETVELEPRQVRIDRLELIERLDDDHAVFEMVCGKGTYVRALVRDLGVQLGCLAHVSALRRLAVGSFTTDNAVTLETLERLVADDSLSQALVSLKTALADIPALAITEPQAQRLRAGQRLRVPAALVMGRQMATDDAANVPLVRAMSAGQVVALASLEAGELKALRVFNC